MIVLKMHKLVFISVLLIVIAFLSACGERSDIRELKQELERIKSLPEGNAPELPDFSLEPPFVYSNKSTRSPFSAPEKIIIEQAHQGEKIKPPTNRAKSHLEKFSIDDLMMVGTIQSRNGGLQALIKDPKGIVHRVSAGMYIGENYGKIQKIVSDGIILYELIPDGGSSWIKSPRTLSMNNSANPAK